MRHTNITFTNKNVLMLWLGVERNAEHQIRLSLPHPLNDITLTGSQKYKPEFRT